MWVLGVYVYLAVFYLIKNIDVNSIYKVNRRIRLILTFKSSASMTLYQSWIMNIHNMYLYNLGMFHMYSPYNHHILYHWKGPCKDNYYQRNPLFHEYGNQYILNDKILLIFLRYSKRRNTNVLTVYGSEYLLIFY